MPCPSPLRPSCKLPRRKGCSSCSHSFPTDGTPGCSLPQPGPEALLSSLVHGGQANCVMGPLPGFCTQTQHLWQQKMLLLARFFPSCCGWAPGGLGGTAGQSFSGHEVKRVTGCDEDLDTHVELEVVDEEGLRDCANPPGKIIIRQSLSVCGVLDLGISPPPPPLIPNSRDALDPRIILWCQPSISMGSTSHCTLEVPCMYHKVLSALPKE